MATNLILNSGMHRLKNTQSSLSGEQDVERDENGPVNDATFTGVFITVVLVTGGNKLPGKILIN